MPSRVANSCSDRARPVASSSNHRCPRATALISAGSHFALWYGSARPGSTSLDATPRRWKATAALSSNKVSVAMSDAGEATIPPHTAPPRTLTVSLCSSMMTFSMSSRTIAVRCPGAALSVEAHLYSNRTTQHRKHDALHERGWPPVFAGHLEGPQANLSPCLISNRDPRPHSTWPDRSPWDTPSFRVGFLLSIRRG